MTGRSLLLAVALLAVTPALAQELHYSPEERLDQVDAGLIATAKTSLDMAAFALTDKVVINALDAAQQRGVVVRIALDPREHHDFLALGDLADTVRVKRSGPLMHLKAYEIDSAVLRTGSANFSVSGETAQDNDLVVIRNPADVAQFEAAFERLWQAAEPLIEFGPAIRTFE